MSVESRYEHYEALKAEAAKLLKLPIDSDNVKILASMRMQHESMVEAMCNGGKVDASSLLAVSDAIARFTPPVIPAVSLKILGTCVRCGADNLDVDTELAPDKPSAHLAAPAAIPLHRGGAHPASIVKPTAVQNFTPAPAPAAPAKPVYVDFSQKESCIKGNSVGLARNAF